MGVTVRWKRGGEAEVTHLDGESVEVESTAPSPPGSRFEGEAEIDGTDRFLFRMKVHGCTKRGERFHVRGRILDLTRERRLALDRALATGTAEQESSPPGQEP